MFENYIFSGFGYSAGRFTITNNDIYDALKKGYFEGFAEDKINASTKFAQYRETHPDDTPFDYFAGNIMGFYERHYVRPFPPRVNRMQVESSLELAVKAVKNAMIDAKVQASDIDAWFVSTVSPHQQAPGIAGSVKSFFTDAKNYTPAFSLMSGCAGFNQNLQKCIEYFRLHKEAKYAVVAHTETMSSFLNKRTKFVPFVTFGDAAAAVIVERVEAEEKFGILSICNYQDLKMLDYVGVDDSFLVTSDKAISDVNFTLESSMYVPTPGDTVFRVKEEFPGNLQFVNYGLPTLDSAFIYDTNGDGVGDSIAAYFNGQMNGVSLENFQYNWPEGDKFTDFSGDFALNGNVAELTGVKTVIPSGEGQGDLKVDASSSVSGASGNLSTAIQDRIGPVIQTASLVKGDGDSDYLVVRFNKPLDESWTSGSGFLLNGVPLSVVAVEKGVDGDDRVWKFKVDKDAVKEGQELEIATSCAKDKCKDGLIKAADGNKTGKNNPVKIFDSGHNYVDNEKNGFYDRDGDGRMDSATVAFEKPISKKDLKDMELTLYWMDNQGNVLKIKPDLTDTNFVKLSKDGLTLSIVVDSTKYDVKRMLTYVDTAGIDVDSLRYGYATVRKPVVQANGDTVMEEYPCVMHDRMSPVIAGTFLEPESFQKMEADVLTITFSEPVDKKAMEDKAALSDCFSFKVDGKWVSIPFSSLSWSSDGKSVKLLLENGVPLSDRLNPADSLKFDLSKAKITDLDGNGVSDKSAPVMVKGDPRVLMQSTALATLDRATLLADKAAFTERFVSADEPLDEEMKKSLGILMDVSFATVMGEDSSGVENMNLDDVGLSWELKVFTNLGATYRRPYGRVCRRDYLPVCR